MEQIDTVTVQTCGGGREAITHAAVARHGLSAHIRTVVAAVGVRTTAVDTVGVPVLVLVLLEVVFVQVVPRLVGAQRTCRRVAHLLTEAAGAT